MAGFELAKDSKTGSESLLPPSPKFTDEENVLCFHGMLIYEARILESEYRVKDKEHAYLVHYLGWNKKWDEWIYERRVLKLNAENLKKQKELKLAHTETTNVAKGKGPGAGKAQASQLEPTPELETFRRRLKDCVEPESHYGAKLEVLLEIPEKLKLFLADDWHCVTTLKRLVTLPAKITVEGVFEDYLKEKGYDRDSSELIEGLRQYFNKMLGTQLLYRYEREQFVKLIGELNGKEEKERKMVSEIYGVPHLIRLITKLGGCVAWTNMDVEAVELFRKSMDEFFSFLLKNFDKYFSLEGYGVGVKS